jgi:hypothetical protein
VSPRLQNAASSPSSLGPRDPTTIYRLTRWSPFGFAASVSLEDAARFCFNGRLGKSVWQVPIAMSPAPANGTNPVVMSATRSGRSAPGGGCPQPHGSPP